MHCLSQASSQSLPIRSLKPSRRRIATNNSFQILKSVSAANKITGMRGALYSLFWRLFSKKKRKINRIQSFNCKLRWIKLIVPHSTSEPSLWKKFQIKYSCHCFDSSSPKSGTPVSLNSLNLCIKLQRYLISLLFHSFIHHGNSVDLDT